MMTCLQLNNCSLYIGFGQIYGSDNSQCESFTYYHFKIPLFSFSYPTFGFDYVILSFFVNSILNHYYNKKTNINFSFIDIFPIIFGNLTPIALIILFSFSIG